MICVCFIDSGHLLIQLLVPPLVFVDARRRGAEARRNILRRGKRDERKIDCFGARGLSTGTMNVVLLLCWNKGYQGDVFLDETIGFSPLDLLERNYGSMFQMGACIQTPIINHPVGGKWKMGLHISNSSLLHSIPWIPLLHWRHWEQLLPTFLRLSFTLCVSVCV